MRTRLLTACVLALTLLAGTCIPPEDNPSFHPPTTLAVSILSPAVDRSVPNGTKVRVEWSAANQTGTPAVVTIYAESRNDLSQTGIVGGQAVDGLTGVQTVEWDTTGLEGGLYVIYGRITTGERSDQAVSAGKITIDGAPTLSFTAPTTDTTLQSDGTITISWTATDPETTATVRIGLDPDLDHSSGNEIYIFEQALSADDASDSLDWDGTDTSDDSVDSGTYNLFGQIDDDVNPEVTADGLARIIVPESDGGEEPTTPTILGIIEPGHDVEFIADGDPLTIEFGVNHSEDALIDLKVDEDDNHANGNEITILAQRLIRAGTEKDTFEWDGMDSGGDAVPNGIYRPFIVATAGTSAPETEAGNGLISLRRSGPGMRSRQVWELGTAAWSVVTPDDNPSPRADMALVYDASRQVTFLFGGDSSEGLSAQSLTWDHSNWVLLDATGPAARSGHAMAFDADREVAVLLGGLDGSMRLSDTWEWNGEAWAQLSPATSPAGRDGHAMAYDAARQRTVVFGGMTASGLNADTWEWDGTTWTPVSAATGPSARTDAAMVYDAEREVIVLFGGRDANGANSETWEFDGMSWSIRDVADGPPARFGHAMAYDRSGQKAVLFGGTDGTLLRSDTWEWDGTEWSEAELTRSPAAREGHALAFDTDTGQSVLFGGRSGRPLVSLLAPASPLTVSPGEFITLSWWDDDPTGVATIRLTVDDDPTPAEIGETDTSEVEILVDRSAERDGVQDVFNWQLPSSFSPGTYYVFAYIDGDEAAPADDLSAAPSPLIVDDPAGSN